MLVDDESFIMRAMARFLDSAGFRDITCSTPSVAFDYITRDDISLVRLARPHRTLETECRTRSVGI